ncbi:MAG: fatty acid biosynthesis transcriptional regulator [Ruminococcaceae bacterium]|nr:fatty acid biosynthesis transcriptional regulator [Oscillospiraceae bacterium]
MNLFSQSRKDRHQRLKEKIAVSPFMTDSELATYLGVSVATVRLDRMTLGIPEVRERVLTVAEKHVGDADGIAEILDVEPGVRGVSVLVTNDEMCFHGTDIVKSQYIYSMAEDLAVKVLGAKATIVNVANIKYKTEVKSNVKLVARCLIKSARIMNTLVWVTIYNNSNEVFRCKFILEEKGTSLR